MRFPLSLDKPLPPRVASVGVHVLCATFARAFDVEPPRLAHQNPADALAAFRAFSASCMEEALVSPAYAAQRRVALGREAVKLGKLVRQVLNPRDDEVAALTSYLYKVIGIDVEGPIPGKLCFSRCYFSECYTPRLCWLMSAFDSGLISGLNGGGALAFETRITEGAPCCVAVFQSALAHARTQSAILALQPIEEA